jgi:hypothetical protein
MPDICVKVRAGERPDQTRRGTDVAKFPQGVSGNAAGRPRGIPDRRVQFRDLLDSRAAEIVQTVIDAALGGDMTAAKMPIDKIVPNRRYSDMPVPLDPNSDSLGARADAAICAMVSGAITPSRAEHVTGALLNMAKIREVSDLVARIERIEAERGIHAPR